MGILLGILISIVVFSLIIIIHEYGHYKTARLFGVKVEEFGLGIPPRAKKLWTNSQGTLFSLNWIPLGGFVKIAGENEFILKIYGKNKKLLKDSTIEKKLKNGDDLYSHSGQKLSKAERKIICEQIKLKKSGENFYSKSLIAKTLILAAGVIMNFLLAGLIFSILFMLGIKPMGINTIIPTQATSKIIPNYQQSIDSGLINIHPGIRVFPIEKSPAETAGLKAYDIVLKIEDISLKNIEQTQEIIQSAANKTLNFYVLRGENCDSMMLNCQSEEYLILPIQVGSDGKIGSYLSENVSLNQDFEYKYTLFPAFGAGFQEVYAQSILTLSGLKMLTKNIIAPEKPEDRQEAIDQVSGPIGIVSVISQALAGGVTLIIILTAIISVNLGVFNLLPIPALDGGRILLMWIRSGLEAIFGKKSQIVQVENIVHILFFFLLIALSVLIAYNDIIKIFSEK